MQKILFRFDKLIKPLIDAGWRGINGLIGFLAIFNAAGLILGLRPLIITLINLLATLALWRVAHYLKGWNQ